MTTPQISLKPEPFENCTKEQLIVMLRGVIHDQCEDDFAIRIICDKFGIDTKGDSYAVPAMVDCVEDLAKVATRQPERPDVRQALEDIMRIDRTFSEGGQIVVDDRHPYGWLPPGKRSQIITIVGDLCAALAQPEAKEEPQGDRMQKVMDALRLAAALRTDQDCPQENHAVVISAMRALAALRSEPSPKRGEKA